MFLNLSIPKVLFILFIFLLFFGNHVFLKNRIIFLLDKIKKLLILLNKKLK
jgi:hypothetical protein